MVHRYGEQTVADHEKAWGFLLDATTDAPSEETLLACKTLEEAWWTIVGRHLPTTESEKDMLSHQLENVELVAGEDPKLFFARIDGLITTFKSVGVTRGISNSAFLDHVTKFQRVPGKRV